MPSLVVEVLDAGDLKPKDGHGSASPYVEVELDQQRQQTQTKPGELNPHWNEKLVFSIGDPRSLRNKTIQVHVCNDAKGGGHRKQSLGRVRISGAAVPLSESEALVQRYPLDKHGLFSRLSDISLRIYVTDDGFGPYMSPPDVVEAAETPLQEAGFRDNGHGNDHAAGVDRHHRHVDFDEEKKEKKKKSKDPEVRTFHSIGASAPAGAPPPSSFSAGPGNGVHHFMKEKPPGAETRTDFARAGPAPASVMQMRMPAQNPYALQETRPPVAAHLRYRGGDKTTTTYDLVEQMHYLYVNVVKAKDLPTMDVSGSLDPYVLVKVGNYRGVTKHLEKNQNPVWRQIFAFAKERLQSNFLEVIVMDKDTVSRDDFAGKVVLDISEVPVRVPPDSPLAPQWYKLENKRGEKTRTGEIMIAVWIGTQADESFPEAWHSDAHNMSHTNMQNTRSKVYFSPKLYYLRVHVIEAQDLIPTEGGRPGDTYVKVFLGNQGRVTKPSQVKTVNPVWQDELMFVASEPFEDLIIVSVDERVGGKDEPLGRLMLPVRQVQQRLDTSKLPDARWYNLHKPSIVEEGDKEKKKESKFSSKICIRFCLEGGYHVLDESTQFSSNLQPSANALRKKSIGILELGILSARNMHPMKGHEGRTTDAYCVAKYGNKWIRTRTLLDTLAPRWNEQYTWDVYDLCTVITIGVFDNCHVNGKDDSRDKRIGKVRVRLSTLEADRVYTHYYPLVVLQPPSGLKKHGELHLALRFTCTAWVNTVAQYSRPLLPKMHYIQPIPIRYIDWLRHQAMQIVAARLARSEPPLRREVVEYMLDVDIHMFSLRRSKANFGRIMSLLSGISAVFRWFHSICHWRNPVTTCLVHILFFILVCYPELILPTVFLYLFVIGIWNYRFRTRLPPHMDARLSHAEGIHPDELDEEFDSFPTSRPSDIVRLRYDRLRSIAGRVQTVIGDLASQGERAQAILSWRDPRATAIFIIFSLIWAVIIYVTPLQVIVLLVGLYLLRHPRLRGKLPPVPVNFFKRLPAKSDMLL
ncbi:hypothetical protein BT93_F2067 [Corymbia citriodora subsp. variegata]|nr:hypothetical protein BT93_F2067 [Corymbia citriodora subsp. variegata]